MSARFELILALAFCVAIAGVKLHPVGNSDLFWHLKVGELIRENGFMQRDPLTFTAGDRTWVQHEWAAQVLLSAVFGVSGWTGLRALRGGIIGLTLLFLFLGLRRDLTGPIGVVVLVVAWVCLAPHAVLRPHLFGWLMMGLVYWAVLTCPPPWPMRRWAALAVLMVVWANLHSSVVIIPALCVCQLLENLVTRPLRLASPADSPLHWTKAAALTGLGTLAQPAGLSLWAYVARTPAVNGPWSTEWAPLLQADVLASHAELLVVVGVLTIGTLWSLRVSRKVATSFPGRAIAVLVLGATLHTRRMVFLGFLAAHHVGRVVAGSISSSPRPWIGRACAVALALSAGMLALSRSGPVLSPGGLVDKDLPVAATTFLEETRLKGHLLNPDYWGGYLGFRLYPHYRVFIDGRWLLVGRDVLEDSVRFQLRRGDLKPLLAKHAIDVAIEPLAVHFHTPALDRARWALAYVDTKAVVLLHRGPNFHQNLRRVCRYYSRHQDRLGRARWPLRLGSRDGAATPTDIPTVVSSCGDR